jgi:MFS transporter, FSR family, fosmidomycin resistance protein
MAGVPGGEFTLQTKTNRLGLLTLAFGHLVIDMQTSALSVLIPLLYVTFKLDYAAAALIVTLNSITSSIIQPLFGLISDKKSLRILLPLGCIVTSVGMVLVLFMPEYWLVLLVVIISGLGSAAFHPEASRNANYVSGEKKASGLSVFFVGGNLGYAFGPIMAALMLGWFGSVGILAMLLPCLIGFILLWRMLPLYARYAAMAGQRQRKAQATAQAGPKTSIARPLSVLISVITLRSMVQTGLVTFIPLYFDSLPGDNKHYAAFLLGVYLFTGAIGTLVGGRLADRFDRRLIMSGSLALVAPLLLLFLNSSGFVQVLAIALAGGTLILSSSLSVVIAQELLPNRVGLASGLTLGLAFGAGGLGAAALGKYADIFGIGQAMLVIALLPLAVVALSLMLPGKNPTSAEVELTRAGLSVGTQGVKN